MKLTHARWTSGASMGLALTIACAGAAPALADTSDTEPLSVLTDVSANANDPATDVLAKVAEVTTRKNGSSVIDATVGDVDVTVPANSADPISLMPNDGTAIQITLPFAGKAARAEVVTEGVVSYDNGNNSTTVPIVKKDGSLQITTIIENSAAPSRYSYPLHLPVGSEITPQSDGGVLLLDSDGKYIGGIAPAWAKDASGAEIATHYEIDGTTLTQVVDHRGKDLAYPLVADPWLGNQLISHTSWSGNTLRVYPTDYGRWGASLARSAAWDEVKAKTPGTRENTSSMTDQFLCHYDARPATSTKTSWNLDLNRPYINYALLLAAGCNNN